MISKLFRATTPALLALALGACASGYTQFYTPVSEATPQAIAEMRAAPPPALPALERAAPAKAEAILDAYARRGYVMIGHSMFNSGTRESEAAAVQQGKTVGADLVLVLNPQYTGSVTSYVPITTPTTTTAYTTGSATAYGSGGTVTAYGNATTTVYGSKTTNIPMTVHRSDYGAVYFIKQKFVLGAFARDLTDEERRRLQTNKGVVVYIVVNDTPAFHADLLTGDVILSIANQPVLGQQHYTEFVRTLRGQRVDLQIDRAGERLIKTIQLAN